MNAKVSEFIESSGKWKAEMFLLREILINCNLQEDWKWKQPCYSYNQNNMVIIGPFKNYLSLSFFKGVLLSDTEKVLEKPGENSNHSRQFKFTTLRQIQKLRRTIEVYVFEAIEIEKAGLKVTSNAKKEIVYPEELLQKFTENEQLEIAFESLTPGRKRAYIMHISGAKQSKTRTNRIEKYAKRILMQKGINDCICGLSKRKPSCDGSHKQLNKPLPY